MNKTTITYFTKPITFDITTAEYDLIHSLYYTNQKVTAIKFLRNQYQLSLLESKSICDVIGDTSRPTTY